MNQPSSETPIREFRYHVPWYWKVHHVIRFAMSLFISIIFTLTAYPPDYVHGSFMGVNYDVLLGIFLIILIFRYEIMFILKAKRVSICVSDFEISITDWRNRKTAIPWNEITSLHASRDSIHLSSISTSRGKSYRISWWLKDRNILHDEIIARAGLTEAQWGWFSNTYTRP